MRNQKKRRIIRLLLDGRCRSKYGLAKTAGTSTSWVMELVKQLEAQGIVHGVRVKRQDALVKEYLRSWKRPSYVEFFLAEPECFLRAAKLPYALTTYAAENLTSHTLFLSRWDVYIRPEHKQKWLVAAGEHGLAGKGNVRFLLDEDGVLDDARTIGGLRLVSNAQLVIDLTAEGGVCAHAARRRRHV